MAAEMAKSFFAPHSSTKRDAAQRVNEYRDADYPDSGPAYLTLRI
jgi:hypothetical protein